MRTSSTEIIDGIPFTIQQLGAKAGRKVLTRLTKVVGSGFADDSFTAAMTALTDNDIDFLCDTFASATTYTIDGGAHVFELAADFDELFAGKYETMLLWLWACLKINFESFLSRLGITPEAVNAMQTQVMTSLMQTPPTS